MNILDREGTKPSRYWEITFETLLMFTAAQQERQVKGKKGRRT